MEKMGGTGLQYCHSRSPFLVQNECDSSTLIDHQPILMNGYFMGQQQLFEIPNYFYFSVPGSPLNDKHIPRANFPDATIIQRGSYRGQKF